MYCSFFLTVGLGIWNNYLNSKSREKIQKVTFLISFSAIQTLSRIQNKMSGVLLSYFVCLPFLFFNIIAVGSFKFICMTWKLYQTLFMFSRISNKSSSQDVMHTIWSRNSVGQNCSRRFFSWFVSHLHHYIINFFILAVLQSWTTSFPPFFPSPSLLVFCFWISLQWNLYKFRLQIL